MRRINFYILNYIRVALLFCSVSIVIYLIVTKNSPKSIFKLTRKGITGDTSIPNRKIYLAEKYLTTNLESAHELAATAAFFSQSIGYKDGEARAYYILSEYNFLNNNDDKSIDYAEKANDIFIKINNFKGAIKSKEIVGRVFLKHGMYEQAQDVYVSSLNMAKDLADNELMATSYANLGNLLKAKNEYNKAELYYKKSNKIFSKINDNKGRATCYTNLGLTYKELRNYQYSISNFENALNLLSNDDNQKAFVYLELGNVERNILNLDKAIEYFKKAEEIEAAHDDNFDLAITLLKQSQTYIDLNQNTLALKIAMEGSVIAKIAGNKEVERDLYDVIALTYERIENHKYANKYLRLAETVEKELESESQLKAMSKLQASQEFNKIMEQEKLKEQRLQEKLGEQTQNHYLMIGMFIPFLVTLIFFISRINISANYIRAIVFVTIILILEFLLVVLDPFIDKYTGGIPIGKLVVNTVLALMLAPLQHIMEKYIKKKVIEAKIEEKKSTIVI